MIILVSFNMNERGAMEISSGVSEWMIQCPTQSGDMSPGQHSYICGILRVCSRVLDYHSENRIRRLPVHQGWCSWSIGIYSTGIMQRLWRHTLQHDRNVARGIIQYQIRVQDMCRSTDPIPI
jgi:hypothetical protein